MNVFISHSSVEKPIATKVEKALEKAGHSAWLDKSDIHGGALLRNELQDAIKESRLVILLWSKTASRSRWVRSEIIMAFHLNRYILPYACDRTARPYFLQNLTFLRLPDPGEDWSGVLGHAVQRAPVKANQIPPFQNFQDSEQQQAIRSINQLQHDVLNSIMKRDFTKAAETQKLAGGELKKALKSWRYDCTVLNLAGYHHKNEYMLKYDAQIQAGRPPQNKLLEKGERFFFDALFVNPYDYNALNGLGSILIYEREYDAAEFFIRRAIDLAKQGGLYYGEASHDLELVLSVKRRGLS